MMRRWGLLPAVVLIFGAPLCARQSSASGPISVPSSQAPPSQAPPTAASPQPSDSVSTASADKAVPAPSMLIVPTGTKLPLVLHNSITTRNAQPGDPVFLETTFPDRAQ